MNITSHFPTALQSEHSYDFVDQRTSSSGGGNSAAALQLSSRSTIPFSTGLQPRYPCQTFQLPEDTRRSSRKASAAVQLPDYTTGAAGRLRRRPDCPASLAVPPKLRRQSGSSSAGSSAAVRQLSSRSTIPFSSMSRFMDFRESRPKFLWRNSSPPILLNHG